MIKIIDNLTHEFYVDSDRKRYIVVNGIASYVPVRNKSHFSLKRYLKIKIQTWILRFDRWHGLVPSLRVYDVRK